MREEKLKILYEGKRYFIIDNEIAHHDFWRIANLKSICDTIHAMNLRTTIEVIKATVIDEFVIFDNVR